MRISIHYHGRPAVSRRTTTRDDRNQKSGRFKTTWATSTDEGFVEFDVNVAYTFTLNINPSLGRIAKSPRGLSKQDAERAALQWIKQNENELVAEAMQKAGL